MPAYYPKRNGDFVYDVTVTKDETQRFMRRYCAHLDNVEHIRDGRLQSVAVDVPDAYGPTVNDAIRTLDEYFELWRIGRVVNSTQPERPY